MSQEVFVITGANGEVGHSLVEMLSKRLNTSIYAFDLRPIDTHTAALCTGAFQGDILDEKTLQSIENIEFTHIIHLAAMLSSSGERNPEMAHKVNVEGTLQLLQIAQKRGKKTGKAIKFIFPSSIAVYGIDSLSIKKTTGKLTEGEYLNPVTMYGVNKLYCEQLGRYYSDFYKRLGAEEERGFVDFRSMRFPGLISAFTVPTGGTSDYAPEMIHAAAQGKPYSCFVRPDAQIPFMAMPDAIRALVELMDAPLEKLTRRVYNIGAFAPTAEQIQETVQKLFPSAEVTYEPHPLRQEIVDSWCADVDDSAARNDWNWNHEFGLEETFRDYLAPNIVKLYQ